MAFSSMCSAEPGTAVTPSACGNNGVAAGAAFLDTAGFLRRLRGLAGVAVGDLVLVNVGAEDAAAPFGVAFKAVLTLSWAGDLARVAELDGVRTRAGERDLALAVVLTAAGLGALPVAESVRVSGTKALDFFMACLSVLRSGF